MLSSARRSKGDPQSDSRKAIASSKLSEGVYLLRTEIRIYTTSLVTCYYTTIASAFSYQGCASPLPLQWLVASVQLKTLLRRPCIARDIC